MTEPAHNVHYAIAGKPPLKAREYRDRNPNGKAERPIGFGCNSFAHLNLLSLNIPMLKGFVNG